MGTEAPASGNRLHAEASAYLRSAARQPVAWRAWGPEPFREAQERDVPVLLDVGAAWCHWCHVMDEESYEDPAVAEILNDAFVAVKVDRDERPDVDARYQRAVQALTGMGGWPLTAFLTPEGRVFYGGTYFPPEDRPGRPSFATVLRSVAEAFRHHRDDVEAQAAHITTALRRSSASTSPELGLDGVTAVVRASVEATDVVHGGLAGAPKFPMSGILDLLLWAGVRGDATARDAALATLDGMARGGIQDHLGGGFHRYSVDARWRVPHFEKLADVNADLLRSYVHGFQVAGGPAYRDAALGITRWFLTVMQGPDGTLGASEDADAAPGDDEDHWTWTVEEVQAVLDGPHAAIALRAFGVEAQGDMPHEPRRNVLHREAALEDVASVLGIQPDRARALLDEASTDLLAARRGRPKPLVDQTAYVDRNASAAAALLEAGPVLDRPDLVAAGLRILGIVEGGLDLRAGIPHRVGGGGPRHLLGDALHLARAHLAAHDATLDRGHVRKAQSILDGVLARHRLPDGALSDVAVASGEESTPGLTAEPHVPVLDQPGPGLDPLAAELLGRLHRLLGEDAYREAGWRILEATAGAATGARAHAATFHLAVASFLRPPPQVVLVGPMSDAGMATLHRAALEPYAPGRVVLAYDPASEAHVPPAAAALLEAPGVGDDPVALVCTGDRCFQPTSSPDAVRAHVQQALLAPGEAPKP